MGKSIQFKSSESEKLYPYPYFPVGSIYLSVNDTNPSTLFGGTWEQITGRFLYCTTTSKTTGGSNKTGSTTLTVNQIPAHTHGSKSLTGSINLNTLQATSGANMLNSASGILSRTTKDTGYYDTGNRTSVSNQYGILNVDATHEHTSVGGSQGHTHEQNLPPYFTVYAWYRTA